MSTYPAQILVNVTAEDIKAGQRKECNLCPIALAVKRAVEPLMSPELKRSFHGVRVTEFRAYILFFTIDRIEYLLPAPASTFVSKFDEGRMVNPFSFTLNLDPAEAIASFDN